KELTQQELAENLGVSRQSVIAVETGKFLPSIELALDIANFFEMSLDELFCLDIDSIPFEKETNIHNEFEQNYQKNNKPNFNSNKIFDDLFDEKLRENDHAFPKIEMYIKDENLIVRAEMPGVDLSDIDLAIDDDSITLSGNKSLTSDETNTAFYQQEIIYGSFSRTIGLPENTISEKAKAGLKNGILSITIPLKKEKTIPRKINIELE
ncbi:MAG: Hsp20 family protein, partial [Patescibacteria group bacterium]